MHMRQNFHNVELIDKIIASIEKGPFAMGHWEMCICGHVFRAVGKSPITLGFLESIPGWAQDALGITVDQSCDLFCTHLDARKMEAIRCLEILRDEGVVDWRRAIGDVAIAGHEPGPIEKAARRYYGLPTPAEMRRTSIAEMEADFDRLVAEARALAL